MTHGFYICMCLCLIIIQTTIIPNVPLLDSFYDIFVPFIICLSISRPVRESIVIIIIVGLIMDSLSGSPFMLYVTAYFWLYVIIQWIAKILLVGTRFRLPFLVSIGVFIENLIFICIFSIADPNTQRLFPMAKTVLIQIIWAFCTGALLLSLFEYLYKIWNRVMKRILTKQGRSMGG